MRVQAIKRGKRTQVARRLSEVEAVEMLVECGELYLDNMLFQLAPDAYDISELVKNQGQSDDFMSQVATTKLQDFQVFRFTC